MRQCKTTSGGFVLFLCCVLLFENVGAQNEVPQQDSVTQVTMMKRGVIKDSTYENFASGEFTPGKGFDMVKTKYGTLNISLYAIARYLNQLPGHQTWQDH